MRLAVPKPLNACDPELFALNRSKPLNTYDPNLYALSGSKPLSACDPAHVIFKTASPKKPDIPKASSHIFTIKEINPICA